MITDFFSPSRTPGEKSSRFFLQAKLSQSVRIPASIHAVLLNSRLSSIVLIAYTNHALDHMLSEILDSNITSNFVRLGSRSSDERIAEYTLDKLEKVASKTTLDRTIGRQYHAMKSLEEQMIKVMRSIQMPTLSWDVIDSYLSIHYTEHREAFDNPPYWIKIIYDQKQEEVEQNGTWTQVKGKGKAREDDPELAGTLYGFWKNGEDIAFITPVFVAPVQPQKSKKSRGKTPAAAFGPAVLPPQTLDFFQELGFGGMVPPIPTGTRPTKSLLDISTVWAMSRDERKRLAAEWERDIRLMAYQSNLSRYSKLREEYQEACKDYQDVRDEVRLLLPVYQIASAETYSIDQTSTSCQGRSHCMYYHRSGLSY
jgi:hypothetical protein